MPVFLLMGCETRSISDSGYRGRFAWGSGNRYYQGELNEMDVIGAPAGQKIGEADITKALAAAGSVRVRPGESLLVVQSGAIAPDGAMLDALTHLGYKVQGVSGIAPAPDDKAEYSRDRRLEASRFCRLLYTRWRWDYRVSGRIIWQQAAPGNYPPIGCSIDLVAGDTWSKHRAG